MHLKCAKMLAIILHENMKLGDNSLSNERLSSCKHKIFDKILVNCSKGGSRGEGAGGAHSPLR